MNPLYIVITICTHAFKAHLESNHEKLVPLRNNTTMKSG